MGIVTLIGLIVVEVALLFFVVLVLRSKTTTKALKRAFVWFMLSLGVWIACNYFSNLPLVHDTLLLVNRALFASSITIALTAVYFIGSVLSSPGRPIGWASLLVGAVAIGLSFTNLIVDNVHIDGVSVAIDFGQLAWLYFALLVALASVSMYRLFRGLRSPVRRIREYGRVLLVSIGGVMAALMVTNVIAPVFYRNFAAATFGPFLVVGVIVGVAYAIVRHGLFDIRLAVARSVAYSLVLSAMVGLYFGLVYLLSLVVHNPLVGSGMTLTYAGIAVVMAVLFQPIKLLFDKLTNRIFFKENYSSDDFLVTISRVLGSTTDLRELLMGAADEVIKTLNPERAFFVVYKEDGRRAIIGPQRHPRITTTVARQLDSYVAAHGDEIIVANLMPSTHYIQAVLGELGVAVAVPFMRSGSVIGYLMLGDRRSGDYSLRDVRTLGSVAGELAIAIQNALSVQEVKDLNASLQQRIDDATKELRSSNDKLHRLDEAKDEFVSMASHQLRTPLTSVKGYISMVLEGDAGDITAMQTKLLEEAFTSSERMVHLINDFLNVSRLQTGKFMVDRRKLDLAKLVTEEVDSLQTTSKARNLVLSYRPPSKFPVLYLDEGKLRQVIMNFIDNAFYYSPEFSTVTVSLRTEGGDAVMTVKDSGMGVPAAEQKNLFTKFFRATNARRQRPDGTGVGLFLAKKVIDAHGGSIIFESTEGKGSTFGFRLPIKKLSLAPVDDADELNN